MLVTQITTIHPLFQENRLPSDLHLHSRILQVHRAPPHKVFISHAGEDKVTIAIPLRERLQERGITAFVDMEDMPVGTEAQSAMIHAMETASVGVFVMSPEFVARKWPMKELMCFLKRREECAIAGVEGPVLIPFFYRLGISELYDEPRLDRNDQEGDKLYEKSRFYERQQRQESEANIAAIKAALTKLHGIMGIENVVKASNETSYEMSISRRMMLEELVKKICKAGPESKVENVDIEHERKLELETFQANSDLFYDVSELVFDFERKDSKGDACTQEGKMLEMLLDRSLARNRAIAVQGISGVGKTSLVRKIRSMKKVSKRFTDGVYSMEVGKDATCLGLKEMLVSLVLKSGGKRTASVMRTERDMRRVMAALRSWFAGKQCLFLIDDIWETKEITPEVIRDLWAMHTSGRDSKTLLTTKSVKIAAYGNAYACLEPREPLQAESRAILYHYAGLKPGEGKDEDKTAVDEILERCAGLPLFLGVAGKGMKTLSFRRNHTACSAYHLYAAQLETGMDEMINTGVGSHAGLSAGLKISIELVEERKERFKFDLSCSVAEMHRRLSVMKKQMRAPMTMLKRLWEVENESEAAKIAKEFEQVGLADVEYEERESGFVEVLRMHDSVYEFAAYETKRFNDETVGHMKILDGYGKGLKRMDRQGQLRQWWGGELEDDKYIHGNLCRHLLGAGLDEELFEMLMSPKWLERQAELNGVSFGEADFSVGVEAIDGRNGEATKEESDEIKEALDLIREAITLSCSYILQNKKELWFQVHGRLKRAGDYNKLVQEYVRRIEMNAPKPGALCMNGILMNAGGPNSGIIYIGSPVKCMVLMRDGERAVCGCYDGDIAIVNIRRSEIEKRWRAHDGYISAIDVEEDGTKIVSGSRDKTAKVWDVRSSECIASFDGHSDDVICVAMTHDGKRVVDGCCDGSIQVWDIESGLRVGGSTKVDDTRCLAVFKDGKHALIRRWEGELEIWDVMTDSKVGASFNGHKAPVVCATLTAGENHVVSGSWDDTIGLWDVESRQLVGKYSERQTRRVTKVAVSSDERRICTGFSDGTVRVRDLESGDQIGDPLIGHTEQITGIIFLEQSDTFVSSSFDGTVRVWDLKRQRKGKPVPKRTSGAVWSVCFSPNGKFVVSGLDDGTLWMWDALSGETVGEPLREENCNSSIDGVAVTPNGRFVISGSRDGVVRVWDVQTRKVVRSFEGHTGAVDWVAVTPDGERAVTRSLDGTARVWDLKSMDGSYFVVKGPRTDLRSTFVSDDGKRIISVDYPDEIIVWDIERQMEMKRTQRANAMWVSRKQVLVLAGESMVYNQAGLSIVRYRNQLVHGEGSEARLLGTLESSIRDWDISPDKRTLCIALVNGRVGFLKLEL